MTCYKRVLIQGIFTTKSNLHIGSGDEKPDQSRNLVNTIIRADKNAPYIPASSIRGFLRAKITEPTQRQALFGLARQRTGADETGNVGKLRIFDAPMQNYNQRASHKTHNVMTRTSIDALTQTAKEHHLASHEIIPPMTCFSVSLELDNSTVDEINTILQALAEFNQNTPDAKLGQGKSIGQGKLSWTLSSTLVLTIENFRKWLTPPRALPKKNNHHKKHSQKKHSQKKLKSDDSLINKFFEPLNNKTINVSTQTNASPQTLWETLTLRLIPQSPLLINDPSEVAKREAAMDTLDDAEKPPKLIYLQRNKQACIPGSTLKGWLRSQCRRILLTLTNGADSTHIETMLNPLFGSTDTGRGILQFEDALTDKADTPIHKQTFIAIDRFTGGAKSSALYSVEAVWPKQFNGVIQYKQSALLPWMKILLLYALRDAMEGDLVLGWGKSKGYGQLLLKQTTIDITSYTTTQLNNWQSALNKELNQKDAA